MLPAGMRQRSIAKMRSCHNGVGGRRNLARKQKQRRLAQAEGSVAVLDAAPIDDEPLSDDERTAIAEARAQLSRADGIPLEDLPAEGAPGG